MNKKKLCWLHPGSLAFPPPVFAPPPCQVYSSRIATLESRVLLEVRPNASLTKELHLLSNDLKREREVTTSGLKCFLVCVFC